MIEKFIFTARAKSTIYIACGVGLLLIVAGVFVHHGEYSRFWANFLLSNFYFAALAVVATALMAINYLAKAGWPITVKRIIEAMAGYLPVAFISMAVMIIASFFGKHAGLYAIYEWLHLDNVKILKDPVLTSKRGYLNMTFFIIRFVVYFALWIFFSRKLRILSLREDEVGGIEPYNQSVKYSAGFLPVFALSFCLASFDWLMSTEPHWFSTIYGVNVFASALVGVFATIALIAFLLKKNGYMEYVNENHFHTLGKFMFGFSIFWTYTWVSQFLLIWYANLPEEAAYYYFRLHGNWYYLFFVNFAVNFVLPFLALMTRNAKRKYDYLIIIVALLLIGRYIDWYLAIMPGSAGQESGFGLYEIGFFIFYAGVFAYTICWNLSKANLVPKNHPMLGESLHYEVLP